MAAVLQSASTGVMNSVVEKLVALMGEQYEKHKAIRRDVAFLKDELGSMNAVLKKLAGMEELDPQTMDWRNQVMGMAFDIEDSIDDFMHRVCEDANTDDTGFIAKIRQYVNELRVRHHFTKQLQELKSRVIEVSERRKRYKLDEGAYRSSFVAIDTRISALYTEAGNLVGIDDPIDGILKLLDMEGDASVQSLRVVSIVGFGGLGKTTLANEVYQDHSIEKEDLVRLWAAEGFVSNITDEDTEKVAGSYFNELVNRSMIQPTYTDYNGEVWRCKVHDMILDLIRLKSEEENFLRVVDNARQMALSLQSRVPRWIGQPHNLSKLLLTVNTLIQDDIDLMAQLPNLCDLELDIRKSLKERILIHGDGVAFPVLKYLLLSCFKPWLRFETGAMPNIQKLELKHDGRGLEGDNPSVPEGIAHLLNLKEFHVVISDGFSIGTGITEADAEATYRSAFKMHPRRRDIKIRITLFCLVMTLPAYLYDSDEGEVAQESQ
nr:unnamed protein product [Digitaria exilis]